MDTQYRGGFRDDFPAELNLVQSLISQTQLSVSTQLGFLQYREGYLHPVTIRFDDGAPAISENPFFYIRPPTEGQPYSQALMVNVEAFAKRQGKLRSDDTPLRQAYAYATAELIMNDLAGGDEDKKLPLWAQEGIAVYVSGAGEELVEKVASEVTRSHVGELVDDLNRPFPILTRRQYARYYLAIQYIVDTGGPSVFQAFVRHLLNDASAAEAVKDVLSQEWPVFEKNVHEYSLRSFAKFAREEEEESTPAKTHR